MLNVPILALTVFFLAKTVTKLLEKRRLDEAVFMSVVPRKMHLKVIEKSKGSC